MDYLTVVFWSLIGSAFSLIGGLLLIGAVSKRAIIIRYSLPFGAGALLAAAFVGLLPEAVEGGGIHQASLWALGGFLAFFVLERFLGWFHQHHEDSDGVKDADHAVLVIIGDTLHNVIDGVAIGAAFLVNPAAGIGTAIAVAAHEIPQEIGDFGILLGKGVRPAKVIIVNLLSALATVVAALATYTLGADSFIDPSLLLALAVGFFIYIAASDIIPDIHEKPRREGNLQAAMLLVGVLVISVFMSLAPHNHEPSDNRHDHEAVSSV